MLILTILPLTLTKVPGRVENGSVTTLVEQTNKLLLDINTGYKELSKQVCMGNNIQCRMKKLSIHNLYAICMYVVQFITASCVLS